VLPVVVVVAAVAAAAAVAEQFESVVAVVGGGAEVVEEEPLPFGLVALLLLLLFVNVNVNVLSKLVGQLLLFVAAVGAPMPPLAMPPGIVLRLLARLLYRVSRAY